MRRSVFLWLWTFLFLCWLALPGFASWEPEIREVILTTQGCEAERGTTSFSTTDSYIYCIAKVKVYRNAPRRSYDVIVEWYAPDGSLYFREDFELKRPTSAAPPYSICSRLAVRGERAASLTGTWRVSVTIPFGDRKSVAFALEAPENSPPRASFSISPQQPLVGQSVTFRAGASYDRDGYIRSYRWDFGDGGQGSGVIVTHSYSAPGSYRVVLTVEDDLGATDTATRTLYVKENQPPLARFSWSPSVAAAGQEVRFDASSSKDPDGEIVAYTWRFGDGIVKTVSSPTVTHVYKEAGTYQVELEVKDNQGAKDSVSLPILVQPNIPPLARLDWEPIRPNPGEAVTLDAASSYDPDGGEIVEYRWDLDGDGKWDAMRSTPTISQTYNTGGTKTVELEVVDDEGATDRMKITIWVNMPPKVEFDWSPKGVLSPGTPIQFDASACSDPDGEIVSYRWYFDGTLKTGQVVSFTFKSPGEHEVKLEVEDNNGAVTTVVKPLSFTTQQPPQAAFEFRPAAEEGAKIAVRPRVRGPILFDASKSTDPDGEIVKYEWDWDGDGAFDESGTSPTTTHAFQRCGTFRVTLRVTDDDGLTDQVAKEVNVEPFVQADFGFSPPEPAAGELVEFHDTSTVVCDQIASWSWSFDDGTVATGKFVSKRFDSPGTYTVTLTITTQSGLTDKTSRTIVVPESEPVFPAQKWALIIGVSRYRRVRPPLSYAASDAQAMAQFLQEAGFPPDHIKVLVDQDATLVNVQAELDWLRRNAAPQDLVVIYFSGHGYQGKDDPNDLRNRNPNDEEDGLDEFFVLYDAIPDSLEATCLRDDDFGVFLDSLRSEHVVILFDSCYSGGGARGVKALPRGAKPVLGKLDIFTGDFSPRGKIVLAASREDQESYEAPQLKHGVFTYFLLRGLKGEADADQDHNITMEELYQYVSDKVEDWVRRNRGVEQHPTLYGQGYPKVVVVTTNMPPVAEFTWSPQEAFVGTQITFQDRSYDEDGSIVAWHWEFGDGVSSDERVPPPHIYSTPETYRVTLTVTDDKGATGQVTHPLTIKLPPPITPDFAWYPEDPFCMEEVQFVDRCQGGLVKIVAWQWDFGDGVTSSEQNPRHAYKQEGTYTVTLRVQDASGNEATTSKQVVVREASFVLGAIPGKPNCYLVRLSPADQARLQVGAQVLFYRREATIYGTVPTEIAEGQIEDLFQGDRAVVCITRQLLPEAPQAGDFIRYIGP